MKKVNDLALSYLKGLKEAYVEAGGEKVWENIESVAEGASGSDIQALKKAYPEVPDSLIGLLLQIDGTYFRKYGENELLAYLLGSDVDDGEYPYYLLSAKEMVDNKAEIKDWYGDFVNREYEAEEVEVDERIINDSQEMNWLHFSDCANNGGTSQLFIDFSPSEKGVKGQIVRFLHDPDELMVIADSFDDYLKIIMDNGYPFINEDCIEDCE